MQTDDPTRPCPDCQGTLHRIRLLGGSREWLDVRYAAPEAPQNILGTVKVQGKAFGMMCDLCGRIFMYGDSGVPELAPPRVEPSPEEW